MAELQLKIRYRTLPGRVGLSLMTILFPVWAVVLPGMLGYFIGCTLQNPASVTAMAILTTWAGLMSAIVMCIVLTAIAEDNRIHASKEGITFPLFMLPRLRFKRNLDWSELKHVHVVGGSSRQLLLSLQSGVSLPLATSAVSKTDLEQLLMAIELWSPQCQRSPDLIGFQRDVQNEGRNTGTLGHTQMWEEELSRRFSATTFMPLEPEQKLKNGKLKIVRQLAFGGLSAIYLAQEENRDLVVLKESVVPPGADPQVRKQAEEHLAREASLLSKLQHKNIARVFDHFVEDDRHYIMLEYIRGQDLRQYIKQNGPVSEAQAIEWGIVIADILAFLHDQDPPIVHRDLTPDNLVLTNEGEIVLIDFGAANQFVGSATGTIVGKQSYIPAEQLRGKAVPQSDIYALAGTIQFLLTGRDPIPLAPSKVRDQNPEISERLETLIEQCTAFEPEERIQTAAEVSSGLQQAKSAKLLIAEKPSVDKVQLR